MTLLWQAHGWCTEMLIPSRRLPHAQQPLTQVTSHLGPWEVALLLTLADQPFPELEERLLSQPYILKGQPQRLEVSREVRKTSPPLRTGEEPLSPRKAERRRREEERAFVRGH